MLTGGWRNFQELEDTLSYPELVAMVEALRKQEDRRTRVLAAVNGVNLDDDSGESQKRFEEVKRRAEARKRGISEEEVHYNELGFSYREE